MVQLDKITAGKCAVKKSRRSFVLDKTGFLLLLCFLCMCLTACGKKAGLKESATDPDADKRSEAGGTEGTDKNGAAGDSEKYVYITADKSVALGQYEGVTYRLADTDVTDEELNEKMKDTLEYFQSFMEIDALTDEVVAEFYEGYESVEELKEAYRDIILQKKQEEAQISYQEQVLTQIVENSDIFVDLTEDAAQCYSSLIIHYNALAVAGNMSLEEYAVNVLGLRSETWQEQIAADAANITYRHTILLAIAEAENITVSDSEYESGLEKYMEYYGYDNRELFEQEFTKEYIIRNMLEDSALEYVMSKALPIGNN